MEDTDLMEKTDPSWKLQTLVIGGVLGALIGVGAAYLMAKRAEQKGTTLSITPGNGVKLGMLVAGMLRSVLSLGDE